MWLFVCKTYEVGGDVFVLNLNNMPCTAPFNSRMHVRVSDTIASVCLELVQSNSSYAMFPSKHTFVVSIAFVDNPRAHKALSSSLAKILHEGDP